MTEEEVLDYIKGGNALVQGEFDDEESIRVVEKLKREGKVIVSRWTFDPDFLYETRTIRRKW